MNLTMTQVALLWLLLVNFAAFAAMAADKSSAKLGTRRVPERTLFALALLGGSAGAWLGMYVFRHKTKHWYFVAGMPAILAAQLLLAFWVTKRAGL